jgi:hypothetical protein
MLARDGESDHGAMAIANITIVRVATTRDTPLASSSRPSPAPLTRHQADVLRPLIDYSRRLRELTAELETLALQQVNDNLQPLTGRGRS